MAYGSTDLSQLARSYRTAEGITSARNIAVFEYIDELGEIQTLTMASQRGIGHAERRIANALEDLGIPPENVTRIYSELHPCGSLPGGYCDRMIRNNFPDADVSYSFEYGDQESRSRGIEALRGALDELFGE